MRDVSTYYRLEVLPSTDGAIFCADFSDTFLDWRLAHAETAKIPPRFPWNIVRVSQDVLFSYTVVEDPECN